MFKVEPTNPTSSPPRLPFGAAVPSFQLIVYPEFWVLYGGFIK
jgi:hypothetical protein